MSHIKLVCSPPMKRRGMPTHIRVIAATLTAFFMASVFAYAGGIEATVNSFVSKLLSKFSGILLDICDMLVSPIFSITTMSVDQIAAYIPGFNTVSGTGDFFVRGIQLTGSCIAACLAMLGILKIIVGMARDEKVGSIGSLLWRMVIFIPLTVFGQKLLRGLFDHVITPISSAFAAGVLSFSNDAVFSTVATPLTNDAGDLATLIVGTILMVMIGYNLIGLVLEAAERYIICIVIIFLSPLAFGAGVGEETANVAKNWLKMFWSHGVLLILNIWVVGIGRTCFDAIDPSASNTQIIIWGLITYAYFKIAQKLDDMMQNSGLMVTRTGGGIARDALFAAGAVVAAGKSLFGGAADTVATGIGVANAVKAGGALGDIAKPISNYTRRHPFLAPTAGAAAAAVGGAAGFASQSAASHALTHTSDAVRAAGAKDQNFNSPAFRAAAQNQLVQSGLAGTKTGNVESLQPNSDGTLSGVLTQRDTAGHIQSQTAFTMSNPSGTKDGLSVSAGRQMTVGADGKSVEITDPKSGTFSLQQTGTDKYGNQIWEATRTADGSGNALDSQITGDEATQAFTFKADTRGVDGIGAQAASVFDSGGAMDELTQKSDNAIAHHAKMETDKAAALHDLNTMGDAERVTQMRDENSTVNYGSDSYRAATAEYMKENGLDGGMIDRGGEIVAQQVAEDGRLVGCMAVRDADGNVLEEKFYALSTQAPEPDAAMPDTGSVPQYVQNAQSVGDPVQEPSPQSMAEMAEDPAMTLDAGYSEPAQADTEINSPVEGSRVNDASGGREESPAYSPTLQTVADDRAMTPDAGYAEPGQTGTGSQTETEIGRATTATLDEVLTAKYQMIDEGHGMVETSDLGKLQVSRISVDEATGDTKWQIIRKGSEKDFEGADAEESIVTFERRGNRGNAQTFKDVLRDIRNTRTFDQLGLIDSKVRERPDDSHLFR